MSLHGVERNHVGEELAAALHPHLTHEHHVVPHSLHVEKLPDGRLRVTVDLAHEQHGSAKEHGDHH